MRSEEKIRKRLNEIRESIAFWEIEARTASTVSNAYRRYVAATLRDKYLEERILRWVLGCGVGDSTAAETQITAK